MKTGWLKELTGEVTGKIQDTKAQLVDATDKVETVIKLNVGLIVVIVVLIILLFVKKRL